MLVPPAVTQFPVSPVTTIDDCVSVAQILAGMIDQVAQRKYPLSIRRGRTLKSQQKGEPMESQVIKAGSRTYFFDVRKTAEGKSYLVITESHFQAGGGGRERVRLTVFPEQATAFIQTLTAMLKQLK
jgi:hypothetical protein